MNAPRLLTETQFKGLLKAGDILIPGEGDLPSFSASRCAAQIDRMLPHMTASDRNGFKAVLAVFRFLPRFAVHAILALTEQHRRFPEVIGAVLRMLNIGVKGAVMTLYYSDVGEGPSIRDIIGWDAKIVEREES
jgi:hypothetical protein